MRSDCLHNRDSTEKRKPGRRADPRAIVSAALEGLIRQYKFYLSFENQDCEDYVSEKYFRSLYAGVVPVVLGPPNIDQFRPAPKSVIKVQDFAEPKALADYLKYLDSNDTAYDEYLAYKRGGVSALLPEFRRLAEWQDIGSTHRGYSRTMPQLMCDLCRELQLNGTKETVVRPFDDSCIDRNYDTDAVQDTRKYPLDPADPLPPAIAALYDFRAKKLGAKPPLLSPSAPPSAVAQRNHSVRSATSTTKPVTNLHSATINATNNQLQVVEKPSRVPADLEAFRGNASFLAVYFGGPPSTYQTESDLERQYNCAPKGESTTWCSLRITTKHRGLMGVADALVARAWYFPRFVERLPNKPAGQKWAIMLDEAPGMLPRTLNPPIIDKFDIRISYHRDSDVFMPFGPSLERLFDPPLPVSRKRKDAPIMWVAHNCEAFNHREVYIRHLMKLVPVHSYGDCMHNTNFPRGPSNATWARRGAARRGHLVRGTDGVPPVISGQLEDVMREYRFYLSFENQNCGDYVTEKYWRALYAGAVPIVIGPPNLSDFSPSPKSVINVDDYPHPASLANLLRRLMANDTLYEQYLQWKTAGPTGLNPRVMELARRAEMSAHVHRGYSRSSAQIFCDLCRVLERNRTQPLKPDRSCVRKQYNVFPRLQPKS
eukprot:TRINITY_DN1972_c0_g2_i1.p1 TRINITY_DN1972_c0_g2~~TRINITY_DN1972_c0_g2_i1.p1  ORF type:complete len:656 (+),score=68.84 TRINITY_DN1972_c0_g2_i1:860-2827(+)